jgi:hypothetical protein
MEVSINYDIVNNNDYGRESSPVFKPNWLPEQFFVNSKGVYGGQTNAGHSGKWWHSSGGCNHHKVSRRGKSAP